MRTAIGLMVAVSAYTVGLWGWCLITGRNVSIRQLTIGSVATWPPSSPSASGATSPTSGATGASGPGIDVQTQTGQSQSLSGDFGTGGA